MPIVTYRTEGPVGLITISRPERRNALNREALDELQRGVRAAAGDGSRVLVITGSHDHFCAGADLTELEDLEFTRHLRIVLDELADLPIPTIAAIAGACMGLGAQIALACDLRIAESDARFAVPVAKLGLMVDHWTLQRLALLVGHSMARWMTLTAMPVSAEQAHQSGFVHQVVPSDYPESEAALAEAVSLATKLSRLAPLTLSGTKLGLNQLERNAAELDPTGSYQRAFERAWASADLIEGRTAFAEKRRPVFRGE